MVQAVNFTLTCHMGFEAAHFLPKVPPEHKCRRLHGHSFRVELQVQGDVCPQKGWVMDYADIRAAFAPIWQRLDHRLLNNIVGLENPTSEILAKWIYTELKPRLPGLVGVLVFETCNASCLYRP